MHMLPFTTYVLVLKSLAFSPLFALEDEHLASAVRHGGHLQKSNNFGGLKIRAVYQAFPPYLAKSSDGSLSGISYELFEAIAAGLNVEVEYVPNPHPGDWGVQLENGSWTGMMKMVVDNEVDTVASGMNYSFIPRLKPIFNLGVTITGERAEAVLYTMPFSTDEVRLFVKRPDRSVISIGNHVNEFNTDAWILIAVTTALFVALAALARRVSCSHSQLEMPKAFISATASVARAVASKGGGDWPPKQGLGYRILALTAGLYGIFIYASYCGFLNGYLTLLIPAMTVHNLDDTLEHTAGITTWPRSSFTADLQHSPAGSKRRQVYERFVNDPQASMHSKSDGIANAAKRNYAFLTSRWSMAVSMQSSHRAYSLTPVPNYMFQIDSIAWPFNKNMSSLVTAINGEILAMKQHGIISKTFASYVKLASTCQANSEAKALGVANLYVPVFILAFGIILALSLSIAERTGMFSYATKLPKRDPLTAKLALAERFLSSQLLSPEEKLHSLRHLLANELN